MCWRKMVEIVISLDFKVLDENSVLFSRNTNIHTDSYISAMMPNYITAPKHPYKTLQHGFCWEQKQHPIAICPGTTWQKWRPKTHRKVGGAVPQPKSATGS